MDADLRRRLPCTSLFDATYLQPCSLGSEAVLVGHTLGHLGQERPACRRVPEVPTVQAWPWSCLPYLLCPARPGRGVRTNARCRLQNHVRSVCSSWNDL